MNYKKEIDGEQLESEEKEFEEIMKKIELESLEKDSAQVFKKKTKEERMKANSYRTLIVKRAMDKRALLGHEARVWDMLEAGKSDAEIENYIKSYLPEYAALLPIKGLSYVLERLENADKEIRNDIFEEDKAKRRFNPHEDRRPVENGKMVTRQHVLEDFKPLELLDLKHETRG